MYCDYYGFREKPFNITPDPGFIFLSAHHREAFAHLLYGIDNHVGFISLTGEVGAGKTTVIRTLLGQLDRERYRTALVFNPCLSSLALMQHINREYGLPDGHTDTADLLRELNRFLLAENAAGRTVVLVIDEAQNLEPKVLEQVRLISNLETERDKLIQIVLVGQPELRALLERPELRQLGQRVGIRFHLQPMDFGDTRDYINHRLEVAGRRDATLFTDGAVRRIFRFSGGLPRLINLVCDRALLAGYTKERTPVTTAMAAAAIADVRYGEKGRKSFRRPVAAMLLLVVLLLLLGGQYALPRKPAPGKPAPPPASTPQLQPAAGEELARMTEAQSGRRAFDTIAALWHIPPLARSVPADATPAELAREAGGELCRFSGGLGALRRLDTPAILEVTAPGTGGKRYLAVTACDNDVFAIAPAIAGRSTLSGAELERLWPGNGYLLWRNYLDIPTALKPGARGKKVRHLQRLLRGAGFLTAEPGGTFDKATQSAVKAFQAARGIGEDGAAGRQTLLLLYRDGGGFPSPALTRKEKRS